MRVALLKITIFTHVNTPTSHIRTTDTVLNLVIRRRCRYEARMTTTRIEKREWDGLTLRRPVTLRSNRSRRRARAYLNFGLTVVL